jgi:pyruvate dehydrogenase E2 component (dihydrolipoamide acetyltransferase)
MEDLNDFNPYSDNEIVKEVKLHGTRKKISEHLYESYRNKIHASMLRYIEIQELEDFKNNFGRGSLIDHFIRVIALSLAENKELNATFNNSIYKIYRDVNISYAVNTDKGILTPVLKYSDKLSFEEFYSKRKEMVSSVLSWNHKLEDILGGTFTITNLGNFGVDFVLPIINPPQVAILGIGRTCKMNISWDENPPELKYLMPITITYDHSVIDGAVVAEFAQVIQDKISKPENLWAN